MKYYGITAVTSDIAAGRTAPGLSSEETKEYARLLETSITSMGSDDFSRYEDLCNIIRDAVGKSRQHRPAKMKQNQNGMSDAEAFVGLSLIGWIIASWITHVVACLSSGSWGFLIAGAIMFPIAVIHGTGVWFGAW